MTKVGFIIYDHMTALDFVGLYDPLTRLKSMGFMPHLKWQVCARSSQVKDSFGLVFSATNVAQPLDSYDLIVVPGGLGSRELVKDVEFIAWLRTAQPCRLKVSVCTGALLLGAAGFLKGKKPQPIRVLSANCGSTASRWWRIGSQTRGR